MRGYQKKPEGHRLFAALYDRLGEAAEKGWIGERRSRLLSGAYGDVLEIGGGTGSNLPHYHVAGRVVITEPDPFMRDKLRPKLPQARVPTEVSDADAQNLPFADDSFDVVVSTLVLCTIPNQRAALAEISRVLRPGGKLLFMEHVRGSTRMARWQDRIEPLWMKLFAGCHPNRDTVTAMEAAGFDLNGFEQFESPFPVYGLVPFVQGEAKIGAGA